MAQILTDAYIAVNGTAWSDHANKVTISQDIDDVDTTTFGPGSFKSYSQGMSDATITATFYQDFSQGTASLDSALYGLWSGRGTFGIEVRPTSGTAGTANPKYTMTARLYNYTPLDGSVGDASALDCTFRNAGTAGITRATS